jgi:hypothetical protein
MSAASAALHLYEQPQAAVSATQLSPLPRRGSEARKAMTWPEALVKRGRLNEMELSNDPDDDWWKQEQIVLEDASEQYDRMIGPLDRQLAAMEVARREVLGGLADVLERRYPINPNIANFLRNDDPAGVLSY